MANLVQGSLKYVAFSPLNGLGNSQRFCYKEKRKEIRKPLTASTSDIYWLFGGGRRNTITNKHMKKSWTSFIIKEMQHKTWQRKLTFHLSDSQKFRCLMIPIAKRGKQATSYHVGRAVRWCNLSGRQNLNCTCLWSSNSTARHFFYGYTHKSSPRWAYRCIHWSIFLEKHFINETKGSINWVLFKWSMIQPDHITIFKTDVNI